MAATWKHLMELYASADRLTLLQFYCALEGFLLLVLLLVRHGRALQLASRVTRQAAEQAEELSQLRSAVEQLEGRVAEAVEVRAMERLTPRLDSLDKRMQSLHSKQSEALEERAADLLARIGRVEANAESLRAELEALQRHLQELEDRLPGLFDRLGEFKRALARSYQKEISGMLGTLDNAVSSLLSHMRAELQTGLRRIDSIEEMMRTRERTEQDVNQALETVEEPEAPAPADLADMPAAQPAEAPAPSEQGHAPAQEENPQEETGQLLLDEQEDRSEETPG